MVAEGMVAVKDIAGEVMVMVMVYGYCQGHGYDHGRAGGCQVLLVW